MRASLSSIFGRNRAHLAGLRRAPRPAQQPEEARRQQDDDRGDYPEPANDECSRKVHTRDADEDREKAEERREEGAGGLPGIPHCPPPVPRRPHDEKNDPREGQGQHGDRVGRAGRGRENPQRPRDQEAQCGAARDEQEEKPDSPGPLDPGGDGFPELLLHEDPFPGAGFSRSASAFRYVAASAVLPRESAAATSPVSAFFMSSLKPRVVETRYDRWK